MAERPRYVSIIGIWDKNWETERSINPYRVSRGEPLYIQENETGVLHSGNITKLKDDIMWYRVIINAKADWVGYLEFCGHSRDNRRVYSRRKITLRLGLDKKDPQI